MRRALTVFATLAVGLSLMVLAACNSPAPSAARDCTPEGDVTRHELRYSHTDGVPAHLQSLDLYLPDRPADCAAAPLVAYVHGGAFAIGDKRNQITNKVDLFTGEGWAFASLNYRLVADPPSGPNDGRYPVAEHDIATVLAYLVQHADEYALDARHVMLLGHSAGAFLVSLVSTDDTFLGDAGLELRDIRCTAPLDTTYDIAEQIDRGGTEEAMYRNAFGNDPATWQAASPPENVEADEGIPAFHIVTRGAPSRVAQSEDFAATLRDAGGDADTQVVRGLSHDEVNDAVGSSGDTVVTPRLMAFFRACAAA